MLSRCVTIIIAGLLCLCAVQPLAAQRSSASAEGEIVWPLPPDPPRIRYLDAVTSQQSLGKKPSLSTRMKRFLLGSEPEGQIAVQRPFDVHVDAQGRIYTTSGTGGVITVFDPAAQDARILAPAGPGALAKSMGLAGDNQGLLYVADPVQQRVVALDHEGNFARAYGGRNVLLNPVDVAVAPDGDRIYVADSYLHQVVIFSRDGTLLHRIGRDEGDIKTKVTRRTTASHSAGGANPHSDIESSDLTENRGNEPGAFLYPAFLAVGPDGTVYVSDGMNARVQAFDADGTYRFQFGRLGDTPGSFARPKGIAVDREGHIYVVDAAFNNVQIFDAEGRLLLAFGGVGTGPGRLWLPLGITIDKQDRIVVADRSNNRLQRYQYVPGPEVPAPPPVGSASEVREDEPLPVSTSEKPTPVSADTVAEPDALTAADATATVDEKAVSTKDAEPKPPKTDTASASANQELPLHIVPAEEGYTWVVGYRPQQDQAEALAAQYRDQLRGQPFPVGILKANREGSVIYRVGVGQVASIKDSETLRARLGGALPEDAWLLRIRPDM